MHIHSDINVIHLLSRGDFLCQKIAASFAMTQTTLCTIVGTEGTIPNNCFMVKVLLKSGLPRKAPFSLLTFLLVKWPQMHAGCDTQTPLQYKQ